MDIEKIGLVLEGGGMRGVYTAGVLDFFLDNEIYFKFGIGVSAGACHGCSYFARQRERALRVAVDYLHRKDYCGFRCLASTGDFFAEKLVYHTIPEEYYPIDQEAYDKSGANFYAGVTNCRTGKPECFRINNFVQDIDLVRASASLPLMSRMVEYKGENYLDGGISDSIPIKSSIKMGYTKNVVVLTQPKDYIKGPNKLYPLMKVKYRGNKELLEQIKNRHNSYNKCLSYIGDMEKKGQIFVIQPKGDLGIGRLEKNKEKLEEIYKLGYEDAKAKLTNLQEFLAK